MSSLPDPAAARRQQLEELLSLFDRLRASRPRLQAFDEVVSASYSVAFTAGERAAREDRQLIEDILSEYAAELGKGACDTCEHCGEVFLCSFHSVLSLLSRETMTRIAIERRNAERRATSPTPEREP